MYGIKQQLQQQHHLSIIRVVSSSTHHHLHIIIYIIIPLHYTSTTMKVTALATTVVISSLPFINGYQTQRRTIQRLSNQELESIEQEEDALFGLRSLSDVSMSMVAAELVSNVTDLVDIEATDGLIAGHSIGAKSSKVSNGTIQLCI